MKHPANLFYSHLVPEAAWNTALDQISSTDQTQAGKLLTEYLFFTVSETLLRTLDATHHPGFVRRLQEQDPALLDWLLQKDPQFSEIIRQTIDRALLTAVAAVH